MELHAKITRKGLILSATLLACFSTIAALSANAAPKRPLRSERVYYRAAPQWQNHKPFEVGDRDYGIYQQFILPDGTVSGPIGPEANGG
jgi:hypothetical protein